MNGFKNLELWLGAGLLIIIGGAVALSPWIFPDDGSAMDLRARLLPPFQDTAHILGTDTLGRDLLARVVAGGRVSFIVGIFSALGAVILGTVIGLFAGYFRGFWDMFLMRFADVQLALPFILLAMTVIAIIGPGLDRIIWLMIIGQWVAYARLIRGATLSLREAEYVQAARAYGQSHMKIIFGHILPNAMGPLVILATLNVANNILLESSLTFLGFGIDPLTPSWGGMLASARDYTQSAPWLSIFPGVAIMLTVLGLNLMGDWLRDRLDPLGHTK